MLYISYNLQSTETPIHQVFDQVLSAAPVRTNVIDLQISYNTKLLATRLPHMVGSVQAIISLFFMRTS